MKSNEIRASYLDFFRQRGHHVERSDSLVPCNDPTLLFTSAGMVQFKPYYTGEVPVPYRRATTSQKCLRAGGKANDLDEVGKTTRHLTFFEMLGNFSFGDYFKQEAITWAWEFSTQVAKLDPDLIWVSVYEEDDDAAAIWEKEIGFPASKIVRLGKKDNFWGPAGDTGACGPCSELHIDRGNGCGRPDCAPGCPHCERFLEYWNLVFPQYDQQLDGSRPPLKNRGIDTGMGLERLSALLQQKDTVFDTDAMFPIIEATQAMCNVKYVDNPVPFRVIADHARALSFMIADGILPSNEGRGYVERRLLRRAARFGRELGFTRPFLHEVTKTVGDMMGHHYVELVEKRLQIEKVIHTEEERFASTLMRGMDLLEEIFESMNKTGEKTVSGAELFRLHDTYGFPLDLATDIATDRGYVVDRDGFQTAMTKQRDQARSAWAGSGEEALSPVYRVIADEVGPTEFVGYDQDAINTRILAIVKDGQRVETLQEGETGELVLAKTPFYAESGGQVSDTGSLDTVTGNAQVSCAKAPVGKTTFHAAQILRGTLSVGGEVSVQINTTSRRAIENHHTATHLLQAALRDILGDHVHQAGSLVTPERLRFDFTHFESIGADRLQDVERLVNAYIRANTVVSKTQMNIQEARAAGAMALFGEKYEDTVRVIRVGDISMELCGGCHVSQTGSIGYFKIISESSIAAGVRRLEGVCGEPCVDYLQHREQQVQRATQSLNVPVEELDVRLQALLEENKKLTRDVAKWKQAAITGTSVDYLARVQEIAGIKLLATEVEDQDANGLRMLLDNLRDKLGSGVVVLGSVFEGKVMLCVGVTKDLTARIKAGDIIKQIAPIVGGGGGGKPDMAQAGGKHPEKLPEAIANAPEIIARLVG